MSKEGKIEIKYSTSPSSELWKRRVLTSAGNTLK